MPLTTSSTKRRLEEEPEAGSSGGGGGQNAGGFLSCCCGAAVVADVVEVVEVTSRAMRAPPPLELSPGYANEDGLARGMAPPDSGLIEIVNKSKFSNEIIAVLVSSNAADVALKRPPGSSAALACLGQGILPAQTVCHGRFGDDYDEIEVALYYGCQHTSVEALKDAAIGAVGMADCFNHVKAYRVRCKGKNVLLKYKDGSGLEVQKGEMMGLMGKKKRSVGGGIDMRTNVSVIELVRAS